MAPYAQWWLVSTKPCEEMTSAVQLPPFKRTMASFREALLMS